jgi:hypothetical protein
MAVLHRRSKRNIRRYGIGVGILLFTLFVFGN